MLLASLDHINRSNHRKSITVKENFISNNNLKEEVKLLPCTSSFTTDNSDENEQNTFRGKTNQHHAETTSMKNYTNSFIPTFKHLLKSTFDPGSHPQEKFWLV